METQVFSYSLLTVVKDPTAKENVSQSLIVDIKKGLSGQDANFLNKKYAEVKLYEGTLKKALIKMFENRTIPAMYAWMNGNIYLDDKVVGIIKRKGCKMVAIREKDELIEIIGQCFRETVNSMPYLKKEVK